MKSWSPSLSSYILNARYTIYIITFTLPCNDLLFKVSWTYAVPLVFSATGNLPDRTVVKKVLS